MIFSKTTFLMKTLRRKYLKVSSRVLSVLCHFSIFSCLNTVPWRPLWSEGNGGSLARCRWSDDTPISPLGLYVTLYKAFLSVSQAWCVYTALGAHPWHWLFEPRWRFRSRTANRGLRQEQREANTLYWTFGVLDISPRALRSALRLRLGGEVWLGLRASCVARTPALVEGISF